MAEEPKQAAATSMIAAIALRLTARAILGNRFAASLFHSIRGKLTDLEDSLIKVIASGRLDQVTRGAAIRNRKALIIEAATDEIKGAYSDIVSLMSDDLDNLVPLEVAATRQIMRSEARAIGLDFFTSAPTKAVLSALDAENLVGGLSIADLWGKQEQQLVSAFSREMNLGVVAGETIDGLVKRVTGGGTPTAPVKGIMPGQIINARAIADSSVHATQNNARNSVYEANSDLFDIVTHLSVLDNKTSLICLARAGMSWDAVTKKPIKPNRFPFAVPPLHPNCVLGDSLVSPGGAIFSGSKRWMDGEIFIIRTAAGRELSATPNHPILTDSGWVGAKFLKEGQNVVCIGAADRSLRGVGYDKNVKTRIHDLAESLFSSGDMLSVPVPMSAPDFHGDGADSQIAVIAIDRCLLPDVDATFSEPPSKNPLPFGYLAGDSFSRFGGSYDSLIGRYTSPHGIMGRVEHRGALFFCGPLPSFEHLGGNSGSLSLVLPSDSGGLLLAPTLAASLNQEVDSLVADAEFRGHLLSGLAGSIGGYDRFFTDLRKAALPESAGGLEDFRNDRWSDAQVFRDLLATQSGEVLLDNIVSIERRDFSGHVYNLQTATGWYEANGIVTHNCRSILIPNLSIAGDLSHLDAHHFIKSLSPTELQSVLGPGRAALFLDGKISISQLVDQSDRPLTLVELASL